MNKVLRTLPDGQKYRSILWTPSLSTAMQCIFCFLIYNIRSRDETILQYIAVFINTIQYSLRKYQCIVD